MDIFFFLLGALDTLAALIILLNLKENIIFIIIAIFLLVKGLWTIVSSF
ncbi:MAG: hypothetical protein QW367_03425 [Candidatus Aenigmatarchaeota archaeon]